MRLLLYGLLLPFALSGSAHAGPVGTDDIRSGLNKQAHVGTVDFGASCAPEVRDDFDHALGLLHHMMYYESRQAFEKIVERQPECAMAHWGVAMTLFQPLWPARPGLDDRKRGWDLVQRAISLEPETKREQALLRAAAAFFKNPQADEWWPRIERWSDTLETAHRERPEDIEIAAFYGLSLIAVGQIRDDELEYRARAAEVLAEVHERQPRHPGAIHYIIHADDATGRAAEHPHVVEGYDEIAPQVPHALHMPSHIYVRLGDWPRVIEWNRRSAEAALKHPVGNRVSLHHIHALDYKLYGYLQQGNDARAAKVLEEALATEPYQEDFTTAFHLAVMPARYAFERRDWEAASRISPREPAYLDWERYLWPQAISWFARGMGAVRTENVAEARQAQTRLIALRDSATEAGERAFANYIEIDRLILSGWIAKAEGDERTAENRLKEAAALERTVEKHPVTPGALLPPYEALGDLLMELERPNEALAAYEASLDVWPGRYRSILGAARAAAASGDDAASQRHYAELIEIAADGEPERPGVREARNVLSGPDNRPGVRR
jgi:tetratricopeptide (TPR) repeat protein